MNEKGLLYGTTYAGGSRRNGGGGYGTVYILSTTGSREYCTVRAAFRWLVSHCGLARCERHTLWHDHLGGGSGCGYLGHPGSGCGVIYSVSASGVETILHRFAGGSDGEIAEANLINVYGTLYGTTPNGGNRNDSCAEFGCGTVFALTP